jgi:hypothetical protein
MDLTSQDRLNLKKMLAQSKEFVDHTDDIRRVKHSGLLLDSLRDIEKLKRSEKVLREQDPDAFLQLCQTTAPLMYKFYTDLFNKLVKDEINLVILIKLIRVLEMIEQGQLDQTEGSVTVGKILKELYVDSALRLRDKLDEKHASEEGPIGAASVKENTGRNISWTQFKRGNP